MHPHLSSEQIDGVLHGETSQDASQHLSGCVLCSTEVIALREAFGDLREATAVAAEHNRHAVPAADARKMPGMAWTLAAALLFASIASALLVHYRHPSVAEASIPQGPAKILGTSISDEALLESVQSDLSTSVPAPLLPLAGDSSASTKTRSQ